MATRIYLVPKIGTGVIGDNDPFRPKYFAKADGSTAIVGVECRCHLYGLEPVALVAATVTAAQHTALIANADVVAVPLNLDSTVGAAVSAVQTAIEGFNIPADWVTSGMTYRQVVRWLSALFILAERLHLVGNVRIFPPGISLTSQISDLSDRQRAHLRNAAYTLGVDVSKVTGATTMRAFLKTLGDSVPFAPFLHDIQL